MGWAENMVAMAVNDPTPLLRELDAEGDELAVRERLAAGKYNTWQSGVVNEWLRRRTDERQAKAAASAEAREEESKAITASEHKLARLVYLMLTEGQEFVEAG